MAAKLVGLAYASIFYVTKVSAYYCDSDRCSDEEYCCGDNACCSSYKVWDLWYFWMGFIFFLFLLSMCTCLWRFKYTRGPIIISGFSYSPLRDDPPTMDPSVGAASGQVNSHYFVGGPADPPPYSQCQPNQSLMKGMAPPPGYSDVVSGGVGQKRLGHTS